MSKPLENQSFSQILNTLNGNENPELAFVGKDLQIKLLKDQLEFTQKQLEEKDKQLEHYKGLVKAFQELLSEYNGIQQRSQQQFQSFTQPSNGRNISSNIFIHEDEEQLISHPGKINGIKGKKSLSFHDEVLIKKEEELIEEDDEYGMKSAELSWSASSPPRGSILEPTEKLSQPPTPSSSNTSSSNSSNNSSNSNTNITSSRSASKLRKSSSTHSALASFGEKEETNRNSATVNTTSNTSAKLKSLPSKDAARLTKSKSMTSVYPALEENRLDIKFPELDQLTGQIYVLSKYQQGCRFLQKKLDEKDPTNTKIILGELFDHLPELMTDPFGNYLFAKIMEHSDPQQRDPILNKILGDVLTIAFDMYGTQSLQKMIPFLNETQIETLIKALKTSDISLIKHNKANYLIQYCLDHLPEHHTQWIYDAVIKNLEDISKDRVGCVIVKKCIDHSNSQQKTQLINEMKSKTLNLVQDPFGNYVVQHILEKFPGDEQSNQMVRTLLGSITELCTQKFSSNVVEKCLQVADKATTRLMLQEIMDSEALPQLLNDRFANFVIQTALDVADEEQHSLLVKKILPHLGRHYSPYTKRLQKKILQL